MSSISPQVWAAIIAGCVALLGYPVASYLTGLREARAKEVAFKLECYQSFLKSAFDLAARRTFETQLEFTHTVNIMNLMASADVLKGVSSLVTDFTEKPQGWEERQLTSVNRIVYFMRRDLVGPEDGVTESYRFPFVMTSLPPKKN